MKEKYIKDYVVIDIDKYNNLQGENLYLREENKKLVNEIDKFKSFLIKTLIEDEDYHLSNIKDFILEDYHFRKLAIKFLNCNITDIDCITNYIKEYKESMKGDD